MHGATIVAHKQILMKIPGENDQNAIRVLCSHMSNLRRKIGSDPDRPIYHRMGRLLSTYGGVDQELLLTCTI